MLKGMINQDGECLDFADIPNHPEAWGIGVFPVVCDMAKQALAREKYCDYSATDLCTEVRRYWLEHRHDYYITPNQYADRWIGQVLHAGICVEEQFVTTLAGVSIGGTPDRISGNTVIDYKCTSITTVRKIKKESLQTVKPEWCQQLQIYDWLLERNGRPVDRRLVVTIAKSCFIGVDSHFSVFEVDKTSNTEQFVHDQVRSIQAHAQTPDILLPGCDCLKDDKLTVCQHYCDVRHLCKFDDIEF